MNLGVPFEWQEHWTGGIYYVENLVAALVLAVRRRRASVTIIADDRRGYDYLVERTGFGGLKLVTPSQLSRRPASRFPIWPRRAIDVVLLGSTPGLEDRAIQWIPDFQEKRLPQFFRPGEIAARQKRNDAWLSKTPHVMLSSRDAEQDLHRYYPDADNRVHVLPFAVFIDVERARAAAAATAARYGLPPRYFICTNQFWAHKNHLVILRALSQIDDSDLPPMAFTGKEEDYRDPRFGPSIRETAASLGVADRIRFLGFIPRDDQVALSAGALAVVQPSLCEGWSTVVEDAKALDRRVLASDIAVHREQLADAADYFAPDDHGALAALLRRYTHEAPQPPGLDYAGQQRRFSDRLIEAAAEAAADFRRRGVDRLVVGSAKGEGGGAAA